MVFANAAARTSALTSVLAEGMMSYLQDTNSVEVYNGSSWVNVGNAGDITEVQAGVGISIASGTGPIPVITNSSTDLITTAGDILYGTAADTVARLGIGTAGQVLKVNSGATAPEWGAAAGGGGMTLINSGGTSLTGASVSIGSIPATYYNLQLVIRGYRPASDGAICQIRLNNDSTANRYGQGLTNDVYSGTAFGSTFMSLSNDTDNGTSESLFICHLYDYANTTTWKAIRYSSLSVYSANTAQWNYRDAWGFYNQTGAISSIELFPATGNFTSGTAFLYGVK
jgi:hypothetical protein